MRFYSFIALVALLLIQSEVTHCAFVCNDNTQFPYGKKVIGVCARGVQLSEDNLINQKYPIVGWRSLLDEEKYKICKKSVRLFLLSFFETHQFSRHLFASSLPRRRGSLGTLQLQKCESCHERRNFQVLFHLRLRPDKTTAQSESISMIWSPF
jgi:hypothetical protein